MFGSHLVILVYFDRISNIISKMYLMKVWANIIMNICHCILLIYSKAVYLNWMAAVWAKENELTDFESCNICALGIGYTVYYCITVYWFRLLENLSPNSELNTMYCIQITINSQFNLTHTDLLLYIVHCAFVHILVREYCLRQSIR